MFTRGVVDLGALRDRVNKAQEEAAGGQPSAPSGGSSLTEVTEATFQSLVMDRSMTVPVVLMFTSERAPQAREQRDSLERLAEESAGGFAFGWVDVDRDPRIADAFQVQGIPMVFAVIGGRPVPGFEGIVPESQLRQFVDAVVKAGGGEPQLEPEDPRLDAAEDAMVEGDLEGAAEQFKAILADKPGDPVAEAGLAQVDLLRRLTGLNVEAAMATAEANPDDAEAQTLAADIEVLSGQAEAGYRRLVEAVRRMSGEDRERVRLHLISLLAMAAPEDTVAVKARRALASALF
ncbi:MAG: tetratricopeptide repeat protein [Longispora sp.]|nr:tetratricopeptide repeat protein [Longispora sp. (in: high G+C Gram-positive bacteria)]